MRDDQGTDAASLADLVASRLCHDLVNPLGAIGNGVELLEMTGKGTGPEVELIRDAVIAAEARIRLFRFAFGNAMQGQMTNAREAAAAITGYFHQSRVSVGWSVEADQPRRNIKLACLMALCAESALPMGGTINFSIDAQGGLNLAATGPKLQVDDALWATLRFGAPEIGRVIRPAEAQFPALVEATSIDGRAINFLASDGALSLSIA